MDTQSATTYSVYYSAEDGCQSVHTFDSLGAASAYAADLVYGLTEEPYAGFPEAEDVYSVQTADGMNHTVTVSRDATEELSEDAEDEELSEATYLIYFGTVLSHDTAVTFVRATSEADAIAQVTDPTGELYGEDASLISAVRQPGTER